MRIMRNLKQAAGIVALMALLSLSVASPAFAGVLAGDPPGGPTCPADARAAKLEPELCDAQPRPALATTRDVVTSTSPSPTRAPGVSRMWIVLAGVVLAGAAAGSVASIHHHRPHPVA